MKQKYIVGDLVKTTWIGDNKEYFVEIAGYDPIYDRYTVINSVLRNLLGVLSVKEQEINAIPINARCLKRNRWEHQNNWYFYIEYEKGCIGIDLKHKSKKGKYLVDIDSKIITEVLFLHELQHLLFGLGLESRLEV